MAFAAGQRVLAGQLNTALGDWAGYSPTWTTSGTQPSIGDGSLKGRYAVIGDDFAIIRISLLWGSTTSGGTNAWTFGTPSGITFAYDSDFNPWPIWAGSVNMRDVSAFNYHTGQAAVTAAGTAVGVNYTSGQVSATAPFTWASGDFMSLVFFGELA